MKKILVLISMFIINSAFGQQNCPCDKALNHLIAKIEKEYPGFEDKTKDSLLYKSLKENLTNEAENINNDACSKTLKRFTDFFKDPHLWVGTNGAPFATEVNFSVNSITIDIEDFQKKARISKDKYEGIWTYGSYKFGIKKTNENEYIGFIIESGSTLWEPKDIKFKLFADNTFEYALLDRSLRTGKYKLPNEAILYLEEINVALVKQTPQHAISAKQIENKLNDLMGFYFKKVTTKTAILKLSSFEYKYLKTINDLIDHGKHFLEESENLIIDLRGNPGGTTDAYQKLLPYISGKKIWHTGADFLSTQTYIDNLETYKKNLDKNKPTEGIDNKIKKLKDNIGKFVNFNNSEDSTSNIESVDLAPNSPKNIIVLANKGTGSSAEYFLFIAKQSKKVKVFGIPSYGALDYGNAYLLDLGCSNYQVFMPTYRALRLPDYPIDNIGIQPDVYLDKTVEDWVEYAIEYLEN